MRFFTMKTQVYLIDENLLCIILQLNEFFATATDILLFKMILGATFDI
jgi:hypothetical protein